MTPDQERLLPGMKQTAIYNKRALTLIELILSIVLISILVLPIAKLFQQAVETFNYCSNKAMANNLLRYQMSVINNLSFSDSTLVDGYNVTASDDQGYGFNINRQVNIVAGTNNAVKRVLVRILKPVTSVPMAQTAIYLGQNIAFGLPSGGSTPPAGSAQFLSVSGGSINSSSLRNVTLTNNDSQSITISGVTVTFTGQNNIKFSSVVMNGVTRWNAGKLTSPATVDFTDNGKPDFTLSPLTTYTNTAVFNFSKNISSISVMFIMSDGSQTGAYNW